jgi:hypothetical protein
MHDTVDTPRGSFPVLPDTDQVVPIHYVTHLGVLQTNEHWTSDDLEQVIGRPDEFVSRTVRLFVVLPSLYVEEIDIPELVQMLDAYAAEHDLSIKLTTYPYGKPNKHWINTRDDDAQRRISIDILNKEIIDSLRSHGHAGIAILRDMHLGRHTDNLPISDMDIHGLAEGVNLHFPRNTEYDYNTLVVHYLVNGDERRRTNFHIGMIHFRAS